MKLLILLSLFSSSYGYHILSIAPVPAKSHNTLNKGIVDSLLEAGHQVTFYSPYMDWKPHPNLTLIDGSALLELFKDVDMMERAHEHTLWIMNLAYNISVITFANPALREVILKGKFDAVVTEWFLGDVYAGFAAVLQVPWIVMCAPLSVTVSMVDDVHSLATVPFLPLDFPIPMNFFQRLTNTATCLLFFLLRLITRPSVSAQYEAYFAPLAAARDVPLPPLSEAMYNISVMLFMSHPSISPAMSFPPNVVEIAGHHINEVQPLPKDIQDILDNSKQGVVYFSMGSILKSAYIPAHTREALIDMLGAIPYTVLWKFEEDIQGLPKNIIVRKWWPQLGVLAHPNLKLFITHGGQLSTLEAIHSGVPLLAVPVYGDQPGNAARAVRDGYARSVPYDPDMGPDLKRELNHMLSDDRYYKQAKFLSKIFNNRPLHPRKLISHYVELAIESKGAYHLRSKTHLYPWYQRYMLDQLAALMAVLYLIYAAIKQLLRVCKKSKDGGKKIKSN